MLGRFQWIAIAEWASSNRNVAILISALYSKYSIAIPSNDDQSSHLDEKFPIIVIIIVVAVSCGCSCNSSWFSSGREALASALPADEYLALP